MILEDEETVKDNKELAERYPFRVELRFRTEESRREFMGQLSDGWGENLLELEWPWEQYTDESKEDDDGFFDCGDAFDKQEVFGVDLADEEEL